MAIYRHAAPDAETYAEAQTVLDQHVTMPSTGRCVVCLQHGPCTQRETASSIMGRYLWLPTRTPGASLPELVGATRVH